MRRMNNNDDGLGREEKIAVVMTTTKRCVGYTTCLFCCLLVFHMQAMAEGQWCVTATRTGQEGNIAMAMTTTKRYVIVTKKVLTCYMRIVSMISLCTCFPVWQQGW